MSGSWMRIAVVGCGSFGRLLARAAVGNPDVSLAAVADVVHDRAIDLAKDLGVAAVGLDGLAALAPDVVAIATPNDTHLSVASVVSDSAPTLFVEKPLAHTAADAAEIMALAGRRGGSLLVGHIQRVLPGIREVKRRLECSEIGRPRFYRARRLRRMIAGAGSGWKWSQERSGGELVHEIHEVDLMVWLCGAATSSWTSGEGTDQLELIAHLETGAAGSVVVGRGHHATAWDATVHGEDGSLRVDFLRAICELHRDGAVIDQWSLMGDEQADASLVSEASSPHSYGGIETDQPAWLVRAVEIEIAYLAAAGTTSGNSLAEQPADAVKAITESTYLTADLAGVRNNKVPRRGGEGNSQ